MCPINSRPARFGCRSAKLPEQSERAAACQTEPACHHNIAQHRTAPHSTTQHNATQHSTAQHNTTQHNTAQHNTTQRNTTQRNTAQHNTAQHSTAQHNTTQHNTTQHIEFFRCFFRKVPEQSERAAACQSVPECHRKIPQLLLCCTHFIFHTSLGCSSI
jgi:hypothetical protein